jgi:hypothetical protein
LTFHPARGFSVAAGHVNLGKGYDDDVGTSAEKAGG